jgi:hypothetical protein
LEQKVGKKAHEAFGLEAWKREQARLENYEYMRDNLMSLVKNSGLAFEDIYDRFGPHPQTLEKWARRETRQPHMGKMYATLQIIGKKFKDIEK